MINYESWMQLTDGGLLSRRSSSLRALDGALQNFHDNAGRDEDRKAVEAALKTWMASEGAGDAWKSSVRNRYHAVEILANDLKSKSGTTPKLSAAEMVAWSYVRSESQVILRDLFFQKKLEWRPGILAKFGNHKWGTINVMHSIPQHAMALHSSSSNSASSKADGLWLTNQIISEIPLAVREDVTSILTSLVPNFAAELAAGLTPFVGILKSGGQAAWSIYKLVQADGRLDRSTSHVEQSFSSGDPALAASALLVLLRRERDAKFLGAANSIASFCSKMAGALVDCGTATNAAIEIASNVCKLLNLIRILTRDCLERHNANQLMQQANLRASIFDSCPILGAYMICCAPSSVLINALVDQPNAVGWKLQVEFTIANHWTPLRDQARSLVQSHRFVIKELERHPGAMGSNCKELARMWLYHKLGISDKPFVSSVTTAPNAPVLA